ncbi:MAG: S8 family serine peptidase [Planctomycetes bacterium]|nr:S8 family serine peptidase [Planctomycetota bacterium]
MAPSTLASTLSLVLLAAAASSQVHPIRPLAGPPAPGEIVQDLSWYPHDVLPPFVAEGVEDEDTPRLVHAGSAVFTIDDEPALPAALAKPLLRADGTFEAGWFVVHFADALTERDKALLDDLTGAIRRDDGSELARWYVPNDALVAYVDDLDTFERLEASERVDFVGRYQPGYKLDPTIGSVPLTSAERKGRAFYRLDVDLVPGADATRVARELSRLGASLVDEVFIRGAQTYDVHYLIVDVAPQRVTSLALVEGVRTLQETGDGLAVYDLSGGGKLQNRVLAVDDGADSPIVTAANFPLWLTHDLQGQGQLIGIVDTSFDWNNTGTAGCGFGYPDLAISNYGFALPNLARVLLGSVGSGGVNMKIPRADILGGATLQGVDTNEHGVGVAGAAAADFYGDNDTKWWEHDVDNWESWAPTNYSGLLGPGIAHEAQLYLTPVMDSANTFRWESPGEFPTNMGLTLTNMANAGVCTTNHSVGLAESNNTYTQTSVVHDTKGFDHQGMLQCMAAGNDGAGSNKLTSQAVVKNALAVGASDDVLQPENRASFSSTGPRFDGARKPDVMAPGTDDAPRAGGVQSLLILPNTNGTSGASCAYQYTAGTSFSSPTMAGAGALVHQYFTEGRYPGNDPLTSASAALMKAMLVNAGHRLTGANLDGVYPGNYQGWGEPNLLSVLGGLGPRDLIVVDMPGGAGGFSGASSTNLVKTFNVDSASQPLKVTLAWTDEPGSTGTGKKLVNDLDLIVTAPGGATYRGNVFNTSTGVSITGGSADTLNNVECVIVNSPATGAWTATVDPGAGNYSVGQGCALVITGTLTESGGGGPSAPVANFIGSPTSGTAPLLVNFSDLSSGTISTWAWTFGDGGTSNATNPSHTYTTAGTYDVSLTVTGPGGSDPETKTGYVTVSPPVTGGGETYYVSFAATTTVPGLGSVADEDIVSYTPSTGTWAWYFDGSDVGLGGTDVNAFHILSDGSIVMSFDSATFSVPGLTGGPSGTTVEDSDLIIFSPTSVGSTTAGSFSFVFDGSDVGLTTSNEDIDGVYEFPGGGLAISLLGGGSVPGVSGIQDEDLLFFAASAYGSATSGTWSMEFDGSDVGFNTSSNEDLDAVAFDAGVDLLFSTVSTWSAAGGAGEGEDVGRFAGTFGSATSGSASNVLDLSALGISTSANIDGMSYEP